MIKPGGNLGSGLEGDATRLKAIGYQPPAIGKSHPENWRLFFTSSGEIRRYGMKRTYWCVMSEFYSDGTVKAVMIGRVCKVKPRNTYRELPRMDAYNDCFDTEAEAVAFLAEVKAA
jgi:hypothetical protein